LPAPAVPFAFADFTWLNGNARTKESPLDFKAFTGEFRADTSYNFDNWASTLLRLLEYALVLQRQARAVLLERQAEDRALADLRAWSLRHARLKRVSVPRGASLLEARGMDSPPSGSSTPSEPPPPVERKPVCQRMKRFFLGALRTLPMVVLRVRVLE
jgi:hypothetical protein